MSTLSIQEFSGFGEVTSSTPCGRIANIVDRLSPIERIQPILRRTNAGDVMTPHSLATEDAAQYVVQLDMPGAVAADISVKASGQLVMVKGKRAAPEGLKAGTASNVLYEASVQMPEHVNLDQMRVQYSNGLLTIRAPVDATRLKVVKVQP